MDFISATVMLVFIMDPIGNIPIFHSVLKEIPPPKRMKIMLRELLFAYGFLCFFLFVGERALSWLGLNQPALSLSGGVILFLIAIHMIFPQQGLKIGGEEDREDPFIVPLAIPLIAGPSAIAALLLMVSKHPEMRIVWWGSLTLSWFISAIVLLSSNLILKYLGKRGVRALEKLMGMLLVMMSIQMFLDGLRTYYQSLNVN